MMIVFFFFPSSDSVKGLPATDRLRRQTNDQTFILPSDGTIVSNTDINISPIGSDSNVDPRLGYGFPQPYNSNPNGISTLLLYDEFFLLSLYRVPLLLFWLEICIQCGIRIRIRTSGLITILIQPALRPLSITRPTGLSITTPILTTITTTGIITPQTTITTSYRRCHRYCRRLPDPPRLRRDLMETLIFFNSATLMALTFPLVTSRLSISEAVRYHRDNLSYQIMTNFKYSTFSLVF